MAKQSSTKSNTKNISTGAKTVTDKYNRIWDVQGWEEQFGAKVARVTHPITGRTLYIEKGGEQFRLNTEGTALVKAYKRYPLNPNSAGVPASREAPASATANEPGGKGVSAAAPVAGAETPEARELIGLRMKLTPRAMDLIRRYTERLGPAATREQVGEAVSAVLVQHFRPMVDALENEQIALRLLRERGVELSPEQLARLRASTPLSASA